MLLDFFRFTDDNRAFGLVEMGCVSKLVLCCTKNYT